MGTTTTNCSECGHPEFRISFDETIPRVDVEWLISVIECSVRNGTRYKDGELIDIGSMLLRTELDDEGRFLIKEPDFREVPISWIRGVTRSLQLLRLQKDSAESLQLGDKIDFPTLRQSVLVGIDVDSPLKQFVMERTNPDDVHSGWFIGQIDSPLDYCDPSNLCRVSIYEVVTNCPNIAGFLAMPSGIRVEKSKDRLSVFYKDQPLTPTKGSFLDLISREK